MLHWSYANGLTEIQVKPVQGGEAKTIASRAGLQCHAERESGIRCRHIPLYVYLTQQAQHTLQYNIETGETTKLKEQEIPQGFNPDDYTVERLWATAPDGVKIPMAIVYKKIERKIVTGILYSYGSYGCSSDVYFSASMFSLIDRGFVYGIAQIRGGSDLGEQWYKMVSYCIKEYSTDFIACRIT